MQTSSKTVLDIIDTSSIMSSVASFNSFPREWKGSLSPSKRSRDSCTVSLPSMMHRALCRVLQDTPTFTRFSVAIPVVDTTTWFLWMHSVMHLLGWTCQCLPALLSGSCGRPTQPAERQQPLALTPFSTSRALMEGINMEKSSQGCYKAMQLSQ